MRKLCIATLIVLVSLATAGEIVGLGYDYYGQATPPLGDDFIAVSACDNHSLALRADGSLVAFGQTYPAPGGNDFIFIDDGWTHALAIKKDRTVRGWGANWSNNLTPPAADNHDFAVVSAGGDHNLGLRTDGTFFSWGPNYYGVLDLPNDIPAGVEIRDVGAGNEYSVILLSDGTLRVWGRPDYPDKRAVAPPPNGFPFVAIAVGPAHALALRETANAGELEIVGWGLNNYGQAKGALVPPPADYVAIAAGTLHSLALKRDGTVVGWGSSGAGQHDFPAPSNYVAIAAGASHSLLLRGNTFIGRDERVTPVDQTTRTNPVTLTFEHVTRSGTTTLITSDNGPEPPPGFARLGSTPFYEIATTALFQPGTVDVCIELPAGSDGLALQLYHYEDGAWVPITTSRDAATICGVADSLSPFAIMEALNTPPSCNPSGAGCYQLGNPITLGGTVSDNDGDLLGYQWRLGSEVLDSGTIQTTDDGAPVALPVFSPELGLGIHVLELVVDDGNILDPVVCEVVVEVIDTTKPTLAPVANHSMLWPPNHELVSCTIQANAADNDGTPTLAVTVTSSEADDGLGDGDTPDDIRNLVVDQATGAITVDLRAERAGIGSGRVYTVSISATDASGNTSMTSLTILVPRSKGQGGN